MNNETLGMVRRIIFWKTQKDVYLAVWFTHKLLRRIKKCGPVLPWVIVVATGLHSYQCVRHIYGKDD